TQPPQVVHARSDLVGKILASNVSFEMSEVKQRAFDYRGPTLKNLTSRSAVTGCSRSKLFRACSPSSGVTLRSLAANQISSLAVAQLNFAALAMMTIMSGASSIIERSTAPMGMRHSAASDTAVSSNFRALANS